jgi:hypothetical protein
MKLSALPAAGLFKHGAPGTVPLARCGNWPIKYRAHAQPVSAMKSQQASGNHQHQEQQVDDQHQVSGKLIDHGRSSAVCFFKPLQPGVCEELCIRCEGGRVIQAAKGDVDVVQMILVSTGDWRATGGAEVA